jgi:acyl carrier protein
MDELKHAIRHFILCTYLQGESPDNLKDDTPLQSSGILDSLATLGVVAFIEQQYEIELGVEETGVEQFDRIEDIARLVRAKTAAPEPTP